MEILFATYNDHKKFEIQQILGNKYHVASLKDYEIYEDIVEDGETFHDNALKKAKFSFDKTEKLSVGDDSGLVIPSLDGRPGVYSARYAGQHDFKANISKVLREMENIEDREAYFVTVLCLYDETGPHFFEGRVYGKITRNVRGENGFGYDPIFIPDGYDESFAEMDVTQKNLISHRAIAIKGLLEYMNR